jgi:hypothetical protein
MSGPGLYEIIRPGGERAVTNVRKLTASGHEPRPGGGLIRTATVLLGLLACGLFTVSLSAQYRYVFAVKHQSLPAVIEALALDAAMVVFSLLALGLARAGQSSRTERVLILISALGSAGMNYAGADITSPRSVAAYITPPILLAVVVDRVIAVVRRHILGDTERSAWIMTGIAVLAVARAAACTVLYMLRLVLAPRSTLAGLRRWVLLLTPLPAAPAALTAEPDDITAVPETSEDEFCQEASSDDDEGPYSAWCGRRRPCTRHEPEIRVPGETKKVHLLRLYEAGERVKDRVGAASAARRYAPPVQLSEGTARAYIYQYLNDQYARKDV